MHCTCTVGYIFTGSNITGNTPILNTTYLFSFHIMVKLKNEDQLGQLVIITKYDCVWQFTQVDFLGQ